MFFIIHEKYRELWYLIDDYSRIFEKVIKSALTIIFGFGFGASNNLTIRTIGRI